MSRIAGYLIARPLLTNVLLVSILILTGSSLLNVKREGMPQVDLLKMNITTIYPGASPEDVELNVTVKLEDALKGISGIESYSSRSLENVSFIQVMIDPDNDNVGEVKADIRRAIETVSELPEEVTDRPRIIEVKMANQPVYEVALTLPGVDESAEREVRKHARQLKNRLLDLSVTANIEELGLRDREFQILLDRDLMRRYYISFDEVIQAIKLNRLRLSGGNLESYTSELGIVTLSEFSNAADVENIIIRSSFPGHMVRIRDVGRVYDGYKKRDIIVKFDGRHGASLNITKKANADIIRTVDRIKEVIAEYRSEAAPPEMHFHSTWDASIETRNRLRILYSNAAMGLLLVVLVLFLFFDPRIALWTAAGIPVSVGLTLSLFPLLGITINSISLLGMVVVLGMVVDDAIIVGESIYREREKGVNAREAALSGLRAVQKPVLGTIITTMIAFFPIYFIPGIVGDFSVEIPTIVIVMLAASFIEATTILPAHLGAEGRKKSEAIRRPPIGQKLITFLEVRYEKLLRHSLKRRYLTLGVFLLVLAGSGVIAVFTARLNMFPDDEAYKLWVMAELPRGSSLENSRRASEQLEAVIEKLPDGAVHSYKTLVGLNYDPSADASQPNAASFMTNLILIPASEREINAYQIKENILAEMGKVYKPEELRLDVMVMGGGPPVGRPLEIRILGQDNERRLKIMSEIEEELKRIGIVEIENDYRPGKREVRLLPEHEAIAIAGLNVAAVAQTIRTAYDGMVVTYLQTPDERIGFRVILDKKFQNFEKPLEGLQVRNNSGRLIPVKGLVKELHGRAPEAIYHHNSYRANKIVGNVDVEKMTLDGAYQLLRLKYSNFEREHPGFKLMLGGEAEKGAEFKIHMLLAMGSAIIIIYMILVVQFNSFFQPAMVIMAIPFGLAGIFVAFGLHGYDISMLALIGILGFTGVVINDSLIMIDFINRLRRTGVVTSLPEAELSSATSADSQEARKSFQEDVIKGARLRLRPIFLTTITTVAGLVPTAYGFIGGFDSFVSPMVMAMTWGLLVGTISVMLTIPVFYIIFDDVGSRLKRIIEMLRSKFAG